MLHQATALAAPMLELVSPSHETIYLSRSLMTGAKKTTSSLASQRCRSQRMQKTLHCAIGGVLSRIAASGKEIL
jgi:hypothetical protein